MKPFRIMPIACAFLTLNILFIGTVYCLNIAPNETTYLKKNVVLKHTCFACWRQLRPLAEVKIHTNYVGTTKWVQRPSSD